MECFAGGGGPGHVAAPGVPHQTTVPEEGLGGVRHDHPQANRYRKLDGQQEAHPVSSTGPALIALACRDAPEGHDHWTLRWTLRLLADKVVELGLVSSLSHEAVRLRLEKTSSSPGGSNSGASPR